MTPASVMKRFKANRASLMSDFHRASPKMAWLSICRITNESTYIKNCYLSLNRLLRWLWNSVNVVCYFAWLALYPSYSPVNHNGKYIIYGYNYDEATPWTRQTQRVALQHGIMGMSNNTTGTLVANKMKYTQFLIIQHNFHCHIEIIH